MNRSKQSEQLSSASAQNAQRYAGLSLNVGNKDKFYYCVLTFFPQEKRWALSHVHFCPTGAMDAGKGLGQWVADSQVKHLVVDFPLTPAHCQSCQLLCPGENICIDPVVQAIRRGIGDYLGEDQGLHGKSPKDYERERVERELTQTSQEKFWRASAQHLLGRSFKRKLKKGYLPYWNRPIDFWVWTEYYDQLLEVFNYSFDSFGHSSLMQEKHFHYLKKHFPPTLELHQANNFITLLELLRSGVIELRTMKEFQSFEGQASAREKILKKLEEKFGLFIYDKDWELMVKNQRAFEALMLAWAGSRLHSHQLEALPSWANPDGTHFLVPKFDLN